MSLVEKLAMKEARDREAAKKKKLIEDELKEYRKSLEKCKERTREYLIENIHKVAEVIPDEIKEIVDKYDKQYGIKDDNNDELDFLDDVEDY